MMTDFKSDECDTRFQSAIFFDRIFTLIKLKEVNLLTDVVDQKKSEQMQMGGGKFSRLQRCTLLCHLNYTDLLCQA